MFALQCSGLYWLLLDHTDDPVAQQLASITAVPARGLAAMLIRKTYRPQPSDLQGHMTALPADVTRQLGVLGQGGTPSWSLTVRDV